MGCEGCIHFCKKKNRWWCYIMKLGHCYKNNYDLRVDKEEFYTPNKPPNRRD